MKTKTKRPAATKQEMLVNVILDRSGSMESNRAGTISGYNEYLKGLRADKNTDYSISLIQFDAPTVGPELTVSYADKKLAEVADLTAANYEPRGMTPLYDAIGECVRRVEAKGRPVLAVIITDGMENASSEFTKETIKKVIAEKEAEGWRFVFLGANIDSYAVGGSVGVSVNSVANYKAGNEKALYSNLARSTMCYSSNVGSMGVHAACSVSFMDDHQKDELTGGGPAAVGAFPDKTKWTTISSS